MCYRERKKRKTIRKAECIALETELVSGYVWVVEREEPGMKPSTLAWSLVWLLVTLTKMRNSEEEQGWAGCGERVEIGFGHVECEMEISKQKCEVDSRI